MSEMTITLSREELEALIRRLVREELAVAPSRSILDDPAHDGPEDPAQDELLLRDALELLEKYRNRPAARKSLSELRHEIARLEAADELPD